MSVYSFSLFHPKCSRQYSTNLIKLMFISFFSSLLDFFLLFCTLKAPIETKQMDSRAIYAANCIVQIIVAFHVTNDIIAHFRRNHHWFIVMCAHFHLVDRTTFEVICGECIIYPIDLFWLEYFFLEKKMKKIDKKQKRLKLVGDNWTKINIEKTPENLINILLKHHQFCMQMNLTGKVRCQRAHDISLRECFS